MCTEFYHVEDDRQRFCHTCHQWFHVRCLRGDDHVGGGDEDEDDEEIDFNLSSNQGVVNTTKLGADGLPSIFDDVLRGPTVRGHAGQYNFDNNWLNTGSGVQKALIREWKAAGTCPDDWLAQLGENFLEDFTVGKVWENYICATCGSPV
jgi:hypothetical protein